MGEDRAAYRREGGPGGADKRGEAGAGATQSFQFVSKLCMIRIFFCLSLTRCSAIVERPRCRVG